MPRIPDIDDFGGRPVPQQTRGFASFRPDQSGAALANVGAAISGVGERMADQDADLELAAARSVWLRETLAAERETVEGEDWRAWGGTYNARLTAARDRIAGGLRDNRARERFTIASDEDMARGFDRVAGLAKAREADAGRAALDGLVLGNIDAAVGADDARVREGLLASTNDAISGALSRGYITAVEAGDLRRRAAETFAERRLAMLPPVERLAALGGSADRLPDVASAAIAAAGGTAEETAWLRRVAALESAGDPGAVNPSGAAGLFQFMPATASEFGLANPMDAGSSALAALALRRRNAAQLARSLGREPNDAELYLAHQQGAGGAAALLRNPNANVVEALAEAYQGDRGRARQAVIQNGGKTTMTAGAFASLWARKYEAAARVDVASAGPDAALAGFMPADKVARVAEGAALELEIEQMQAAASYLAGFDDFVSAVRAGADIEPAVAAQYSDAALNALIDDPAQRQLLRGTRDDAILSADVSRRLRGASPEEITAMAQEIASRSDGMVYDAAGLALAPSRAQMATAFASAINEDLRARRDDPAGYAVGSSVFIAGMADLMDRPGGAAAYAEATLAEQGRLGIAPRDRRVLTKGEAEELAARINETKAADVGALYRDLSSSYGRHAGLVVGQLEEAGVDPAKHVAGLYADRPATSQAIAAVAGMERSELTAGMAETDVRDLRAALIDEMTGFREAFLAGDFSGVAQRRFTALFDVAERLALEEARRTGDVSRAVERAAERLVGEVYEVFDGSDILAYVPRAVNGRPVDMREVERAADRLRRREAIEAFGPRPFGGATDDPDDLRRVRTIGGAENGVWITDDAGDGLVLVVDMGDGTTLPVVNEAGEPYGFKVIDAARAGR